MYKKIICSHGQIKENVILFVIHQIKLPPSHAKIVDTIHLLAPTQPTQIIFKRFETI